MGNTTWIIFGDMTYQEFFGNCGKNENAIQLWGLSLSETTAIKDYMDRTCRFSMGE